MSYEKQLSVIQRSWRGKKKVTAQKRHRRGIFVSFLKKSLNIEGDKHMTPGRLFPNKSGHFVDIANYYDGNSIFRLNGFEERLFGVCSPLFANFHLNSLVFFYGFFPVEIGLITKKHFIP